MTAVIETIPSAPWWADYMLRCRFLDGGRDNDLVDCYGLARLIYAEQLKIDLPEWPGLTLDVVTGQDLSFADGRFVTDYDAVQMGLEMPFDMAVIRRALPVRGELKRGWWHVGVVTREGHLLHIDYHQGVVEVPFRDTDVARESTTIRARDVRLFRYRPLVHAMAAALRRRPA